MAKKYNNYKGFLIIQMTRLEAINDCGFGIKTSRLNIKLLCDNCNNEIDSIDYIYYFAVFNRVFCKECTDDIIKNINRISEDNHYKKAYYNYYAEKLNLEIV